MDKNNERDDAGLLGVGSFRPRSQRVDHRKPFSEEAPRRNNGAEEKITLNSIIIAAQRRGLEYEIMKHMTLGQIVDFCVEHDNQRKKEERANSGSVRRMATPEETDAWLAGL